MVIAESEAAPAIQVTRQAASWVSSRPAMPSTARAWARHALLDWLGAAIAGASDPLVGILRDELAGPGEVTLIGGGTTDQQNAALVNGAAGHALDYDDVVSALTGHPTAPVAPAILALGEQAGTSGADLLDALIAGIEVETALGAMTNSSHYERGFHATGTLGTLGAAAASAHLLRLDSERTAHALGIAASQAAGLKCNFGTMTKPLHVGKAAANGLLAARLARRGFTANREAIETQTGFMWTLSPEFHPAPFRPDAGPNGGAPMWIEQLLFKHHAACYLTHAPMNAVIALRDRHGLGLDDMHALTLTVSPRHLDVCNIADPATGLEVKFSLRHTAVMALAGAETAALDAYSDATAQDPALTSARQRIDVVTQADRDWMTGHARITLSDGTILEAEADAGQPADGLDQQWHALSSKFTTLVGPVLGARRAATLIDAIAGIEQMGDISDLMALTPLTRTPASPQVTL